LWNDHDGALLAAFTLVHRGSHDVSFTHDGALAHHSSTDHNRSGCLITANHLKLFMSITLLTCTNLLVSSTDQISVCLSTVAQLTKLYVWQRFVQSLTRVLHRIMHVALVLGRGCGHVIEASLSFLLIEVVNEKWCDPFALEFAKLILELVAKPSTAAVLFFDLFLGVHHRRYKLILIDVVLVVGFLCVMALDYAGPNQNRVQERSLDHNGEQRVQ